MSTLFFDSSALAKRYMPEIGTAWVRKQTATNAGNEIIIAQITPVELYSAMARQHHDSHIDMMRLQAFRRLLMRHIQDQYLVLALSAAVIKQALSLHETYRLRAYDSIQLASALELHTRLAATQQTLTFIAADEQLLQSAVSAGLPTDNPSHYH
jgi:predicted nucleic acid-binding protein